MFTYDPSTPLGLVRLIIGDTVHEKQVFEDEEVTAFLSLVNGDMRLAAAMALDRIATSQALLLKVIRDMELSTDGAALARALRDHAKALREAVASEPAWGIADLNLNAFAEREILWKAALRRVG